MKKLLALLSLSVLATTQLPFNTINFKNPSHNLQNLNYNLKSNNDQNIIYPKNIEARILAVTPNSSPQAGTIWAGGNDGKIYKQIAGTFDFDLFTTLDSSIINLIVGMDGSVYASTQKGVVYKSFLGAQEFKKISTLPGLISSLAVDDEIVYATSNNDHTQGEAKGTVYKSLNNGNFTVVKKFDKAIQSLAVGLDGTIWVGGVNVVYKSTDGQNFLLTTGTSDIIFALTVGLDGTIWAGAHSGKVYKSTDGQNFLSTTGTSGYINSLSVDSYGTIYISSSNGLYKSIGENNFIRINQNLKKVSSTVVGLDNSIYISENNSIFQLRNELDLFKDQVSFTLVDPTKKLSWISNDNLTASGKLNGHVESNGINFIQLNGQTLPQTNKVWDFEMGEEGKNIDYKINVNFTFDNKVYNAEMVVSILMDTPKISVKTNQGALISQYATILPGAEKFNDISTSTPIYFSKTEALISLLKPTWASSLTGIVYGLNADWQKNGQSQSIAESDTVNIDGSQLGAYNGRYLVETTDNAGNSESYYAVVSDDDTQKPINFWNTEDGQYFFEYAIINGFDGNKIKAFNSKEINDLINQSLEWENDLATDSQILEALVSTISENLNIGTSSFISHDEVITKLKSLIPDKLEISGFFTNLYNVNNVVIDLENSNEGFAVGDTVSFKISYQGETSESISFTINEIAEPTSNWVKIIVVVGSSVIILLAGFFGYKFVSKKIRLKKEAEHVARETNQNKTKENF